MAAAVGGRMEAVVPHRSLFAADYMCITVLGLISAAVHVWLVSNTAVTARDSIVHFRLDDAPELIRARVASDPHSTYLVCDGNIDKPVGYVDAKDILTRVI